MNLSYKYVQHNKSSSIHMKLILYPEKNLDIVEDLSI